VCDHASAQVLAPALVYFRAPASRPPSHRRGQESECHHRRCRSPSLAKASQRSPLAPHAAAVAARAAVISVAPRAAAVVATSGVSASVARHAASVAATSEVSASVAIRAVVVLMTISAADAETLVDRCASFRRHRLRHTSW
jgi:hypothetical protein